MRLYRIGVALLSLPVVVTGQTPPSQPTPSPDSAGHPSQEPRFAKLCEALDLLLEWKAWTISNDPAITDRACGRLIVLGEVKPEILFVDEIRVPDGQDPPLAATSADREYRIFAGTADEQTLKYYDEETVGESPQATAVKEEFFDAAASLGPFGTIIIADVLGHEAGRHRQRTCTTSRSEEGRAEVTNNGRVDAEAIPDTDLGEDVAQDAKQLAQAEKSLFEADASFLRFVLAEKTGGLSSQQVEFIEDALKNHEAKVEAEAENVANVCARLAQILQTP